MYRGRIKKIHFVGIGGSGMNGIAEVLLNMGYRVTGSDLVETETTRRLAGLGATVYIGHRSENVHGSQCVVYSSAVKRGVNPELKEAASLQIPIIPRAEMLSELMRMKYGIAVAGTHGKTTTTSMIASVLNRADIDPTVVTGGKLNNIGANARLGAGDFLVAEADESDGSFLTLCPTIAVVTNIDREHMDHYSGMEEVLGAYLDFMNKVPFYGCTVLCLDHPVIQCLVPGLTRRFITYGLTAQADVHAKNIRHKGMKTTFEVYYEKEMVGEITLQLPGKHNVYNALAAVAVAREMEIGFGTVKAGLEEFTGVERRFHVRGVEAGVTVVDDYGHHPNEIRAVIEAAKKGFGKRLVVVFQPHRYTRTKDLFDDFITAFNDAEKLVLTEIYPAGEEEMEGVSGEVLYSAIKDHGHKDVTYVPALADVAARLEEVVETGDMVITLGAGNVWTAGVSLLEMLKKRKTASRLSVI
ncbi:MAG TPA: UDP-N-acetylmuramate--L-alanine ligase [Thermodesulfobacteriota bacterium]|nr:UDP-N-acetylmuramate--L-alanine ligase [Thermodesulfobacteriota bacterium]